MQASFFNTTNERQPERTTYEAKAVKQEDLILRLYKSMREPMSPDKVSRLLGDAFPITSVRRAITNLTGRGQLVKTTRKIQGRYGRPNYLWKAA